MIFKLEEILKKENIGREFIFMDNKLKEHFLHKIVLCKSHVCYLSSLNTVVNPKNLKRLDHEVVLISHPKKDYDAKERVV